MRVKCFLCLDHVQVPNKASLKDDGQLVQRFLQLTKQLVGGDVEEMEGKMTTCLKCRLKLKEVVKCQGEMDKVEGTVRRLQRELLEEMRVLRGKMEGFKQSLEGILEVTREEDGNLWKGRILQGLEQLLGFQKSLGVKICSDFEGRLKPEEGVQQVFLMVERDDDDDHVNRNEEEEEEEECQDDDDDKAKKITRGRSLTTVKCPKCPKMFKKRYLKEHLQRRHSNDFRKVDKKQDTLTKTPRKSQEQVKCPKCPQFVTRCYLQQHLNRRHGQNLPLSSLGSPMSSSKSPESSEQGDNSDGDDDDMVSSPIPIHSQSKEKSVAMSEGDNEGDDDHDNSVIDDYSSDAQPEAEPEKPKWSLDKVDHGHHPSEPEPLSTSTQPESQKVDDDHAAPSSSPPPFSYLAPALFPCPLCPRSFVTSFKLLYHTRYHHEPDLRHPCPSCSLLIKGRTLRNHLAYHCPNQPKNKQATCHLCGKTVFSQFALEKHLKTTCPSNPDTTKKPDFGCTLCGKSGFTSETYLKMHLKRHNNAATREEICDRCGKPFNSKVTLKQHLKRCNGQGKIRQPHWSRMTKPIKLAENEIDILLPKE